MQHTWQPRMWPTYRIEWLTFTIVWSVFCKNNTSYKAWHKKIHCQILNMVRWSTKVNVLIALRRTTSSGLRMPNCSRLTSRNGADESDTSAILWKFYDKMTGRNTTNYMYFWFTNIGIFIYNDTVTFLSSKIQKMNKKQNYQILKWRLTPRTASTRAKHLLIYVSHLCGLNEV